MRRECLDVLRPRSLHALDQALRGYAVWYNFYRRHQGQGMHQRTPAEVMFSDRIPAAWRTTPPDKVIKIPFCWGTLTGYMANGDIPPHERVPDHLALIELERAA